MGKKINFLFFFILSIISMTFSCYAVEKETNGQEIKATRICHSSEQSFDVDRYYTTEPLKAEELQSLLKRFVERYPQTYPNSMPFEIQEELYKKNTNTGDLTVDRYNLRADLGSYRPSHFDTKQVENVLSSKLELINKGYVVWNISFNIMTDPNEYHLKLAIINKNQAYSVGDHCSWRSSRGSRHVVTYFDSVQAEQNRRAEERAKEEAGQKEKEKTEKAASPKHTGGLAIGVIKKIGSPFVRKRKEADNIQIQRKDEPVRSTRAITSPPSVSSSSLGDKKRNETPPESRRIKKSSPRKSRSLTNLKALSPDLEIASLKEELPTTSSSSNNEDKNSPPDFLHTYKSKKGAKSDVVKPQAPKYPLLLVPSNEKNTFPLSPHKGDTVYPLASSVGKGVGRDPLRRSMSVDDINEIFNVRSVSVRELRKKWEGKSSRYTNNNKLSNRATSNKKASSPPASKSKDESLGRKTPFSPVALTHSPLWNKKKQENALPTKNEKNASVKRGSASSSPSRANQIVSPLSARRDNTTPKTPPSVVEERIKQFDGRKEHY